MTENINNPSLIDPRRLEISALFVDQIPSSIRAPLEKW